LQHSSLQELRAVLQGATESLQAVQREAGHQRDSLSLPRGLDGDGAGQLNAIMRASQPYTGATTAALAARSALLPAPQDNYDHERALLDVQMAVLTAIAPGEDADGDMDMPAFP